MSRSVSRVQRNKERGGYLVDRAEREKMLISSKRDEQGCTHSRERVLIVLTAVVSRASALNGISYRSRGSQTATQSISPFSLVATPSPFISDSRNVLRTEYAMFGPNSDPRGVTKSLKYPPAASCASVTVLLTGANTGIGQATAQYLYSHGATVILACRTESKATAAIHQMTSAPPALDHAQEPIAPGSLSFLPLDLSKLESAQDCVKLWQESRTTIDGAKLDILICNAGAIWLEKKITQDRFEMMYQVSLSFLPSPCLQSLPLRNDLTLCEQTNYLTHTLLTLLFLPFLALAPAPRIINVSSFGAYRKNGFANNGQLANLNGELYPDQWNVLTRFPRGMAIYSQTKLLQVCFGLSLHHKFSADPKYSKIVVSSLHPGVVASSIAAADQYGFSPWVSSIIARVFGMLGRTVEQGAMTSIWVALSDEAKESGKFWADCGIAETPSGAVDPEMRELLFQRTLKDIGMEDWKLE